MGLRLKQISLINFRNYEDFHLDDIGSLTIFVGPNAVGKTNIIEGISLLTALTSFRKPKTAQLVRWGAAHTRLTASVGDGSRSLDVMLQIKDAQKFYYLNDKAKRIQDIKGTLPAVCFSPDDLNLIKGSQSIKRYALDALGSQLSANYYAVRKDYEKILKQKNQLLKECADARYLESINEVFISISAQLSFKRAEVMMKLVPYIQEFYHAITGGQENIQVSYIPSWIDNNQEIFLEEPFTTEEARTALEKIFNANGFDEITRKRSLWGAHTDCVEFFINGKNAGIYGSQGQQRSLVLSLKLAEVALIQQVLGQQPVLLLDDVMSELDEARRTALVGFISRDIQTFITTTDLKYFNEEIVSRARIVSLENPSVLPEESKREDN